MKYIRYLLNKYGAFFMTMFKVMKVLYKAKSHVVGFSVNIITEDCLKDFEKAVKEREAHLDSLRVTALDNTVSKKKSDLN